MASNEEIVKIVFSKNGNIDLTAKAVDYTVEKVKEILGEEISSQDFKRYQSVRNSGVTNMYALTTVSELSGLSKDKLLIIMSLYDELTEKYEE